jgi:hypothetical protein
MIKNTISIEEIDNGFIVKHDRVEVDEETGKKIKKYEKSYCVEGTGNKGVANLLGYIANYYGKNNGEYDKETIKIFYENNIINCSSCN